MPDLPYPFVVVPQLYPPSSATVCDITNTLDHRIPNFRMIMNRDGECPPFTLPELLMSYHPHSHLRPSHPCADIDPMEYLLPIIAVSSNRRRHLYASY